MIKNGSLVRFEYTLSDENGNVLQSNKGKDPLSYTHGRHERLFQAWRKDSPDGDQ